jgi:hypothetical protein
MASTQAVDDCCDNNTSNLDEKYTAQQLPSWYSAGPREPKKCTDVACCLIFLLCVAGLIIAAFMHAPTSKIGLMSTPRDSVGNVCGVDEATKDYPYLLMYKFTSPYRSACVKQCPKFDYNQFRYNSSGTNTSAIAPVYWENFTQAVKQHNTSWDGVSRPREVTSADDPDLFAYDPVSAQGYYTEAQWNASLPRVKIDCKTNANVTSCNHDPSKGNFAYDSRAISFNICLPLLPRLLQFSAFTKDIQTGWVSDLKNSWWLILLAVISTVIIGMIFLAIATYFLPCLLWTQIILAILLLLFLGIFAISAAVNTKNPYVNGALDRADSYSVALRSRYEAIKDRVWILWVAGIVLILLAILLAWTVLSNRSGITTSLEVLAFASKFVTSNILVVVVAIICFIFQIITFLLTLWGLLIVHTSGNLIKDPTGYPLPKFEYTWGKWFLWYFGIFVIYWTVLFWNNFSDMVCAGTACHWYFKQNVGVIGTTIKVIIYHLGTVAFCSLILLPVTIVQLIFGWFYAMFTDDKPNVIQKCMTKVCCCLIYPYQKFFNRTSEAGLAMAYFGSCNYCPSTKRNHYLNRRVGDTIGNVSFIGFIFKITGVIAIASLNYLLFNWLITNTDYFRTRVQNPMVPLFSIWIFGLVVAALFMSIYSTACDALLMCGLIDLDHNKDPASRHRDFNLPRKVDSKGYTQLTHK